MKLNVSVDLEMEIGKESARILRSEMIEMVADSMLRKELSKIKLAISNGEQPSYANIKKLTIKCVEKEGQKV